MSGSNTTSILFWTLFVAVSKFTGVHCIGLKLTLHIFVGS